MDSQTFKKVVCDRWASSINAQYPPRLVREKGIRDGNFLWLLQWGVVSLTY